MLELFKHGTTSVLSFRYYVYIPVVTLKHVLVGINVLVILVKFYETTSFVYKIQKQKFKHMNFLSDNSLCSLFSK